MKTHDLKIYPEYFWPIVNGIKTFEIRRNGNNFQVNDVLCLREYNPATESYTGSYIVKTVIYICDYAQKENYVVMSIK